MFGELANTTTLKHRRGERKKHGGRRGKQRQRIRKQSDSTNMHNTIEQNIPTLAQHVA
jgi:hypothetical protein